MRIFKRTFIWIRFSFYYVKELLRANFRIAYDVLTPRLRMKPGFIALPMKVDRDFEVLLFSNLLTMTPGTLIVELSKEERKIYIHAMYLDNVEEIRINLGEYLQSRVLQLVR